ncbi:MAG: holo-ACP synthase [candidate division Zixibacteria bacterium]|nr:holo-ACP synthase [candidate division Zixibacteria bacterium]
MVDSLGIDIVEVKRVKKLMEKWGDRFLHRVFTPWEIAYCKSKSFPEQSFAARFAAKEAILKTIGTGLSGGIRWTSMEIVNDKNGRPGVKLGKRIKDKIKNKRILISMSHTKEYAVAQAILVD